MEATRHVVRVVSSLKLLLLLFLLLSVMLRFSFWASEYNRTTTGARESNISFAVDWVWYGTSLATAASAMLLVALMWNRMLNWNVSMKNVLLIFGSIFVLLFGLLAVAGLLWYVIGEKVGGGGAEGSQK
jgi:hypothetical protein